MKLLISIVAFLYIVKDCTSIAECVKDSENIINPNEDPVSRQLYDFKDKHPNPERLTTSGGLPIDNSETCTLNEEPLLRPFLIETTQHTIREKIPERTVFTKGTGAFGYFEVTNDVSKYTKIKMFETVGKKTPLVTRFAVSQIEKGGSELFLVAIRGMSVKFYTEEGNFDLLGAVSPVYLYRDPLLFNSIVHAFRQHPKTNVYDFTTSIDFLLNNPVALHGILWLLSEFGLPRCYRHMNSFPGHTYELYNCEGRSYFVKFNILSGLGFKSFTIEESAAISSFDPDFCTRDLYNSIEMGDYPSWKLEMQVLKAEDPTKCDFDPFDVTNLWPNGTYDVVEIGRIVLNKTVDNHFAQVEQATYNPGNLVPGIMAHDQLFKGRILAYNGAQIHRDGNNWNKLPINCPISNTATYNRDGSPPVNNNMGDAPNYFPNSFNGPIPNIDDCRPQRSLNLFEVNDVSLNNCREFYNVKLKTDKSKQRLVDNLARASLRVDCRYREKFAKLLSQVDEDFGTRYRRTVSYLEKNVILPKVFEDVNKTNPNPFSTIKRSN